MTTNTINNDVTMPGSEGALLAGRFRIVRQLGQGGMGSVWLAEDTQLDNKLFAIKMLPSILVSNKRAYRQLKDEALVAMKLTHPNIVTLRAFEENNGNPFLVMDYVDGETLDDLLAEKGKLSEEETIKLLKPVAAALDYAHSQGVVHRDVKPGNIMIRRDGTPFILDFGIAREIQETMTRVTGKLSSGTLLYMSPEQLRGLPPKPAQDIYSFAAMAYECLNGEPPFARGQVEYQILNESPKPLLKSVMCSSAVMRGLSKASESRPCSCAKVLASNPPPRQLTASRRITPAQPSRQPSPQRNIVVGTKHTRMHVIAPAVCLAMALLMLFVVLWHRNVQAENAARLRRLAEEDRIAAEESARQKEEEARKAQAEADRKAREKAEEDRKAREKAEEDHKAREKASESRAKAVVRKGDVESLSDKDGFEDRKDTLKSLFSKADKLHEASKWTEASAAFLDYVAKCDDIIALDRERGLAVNARVSAQTAFRAAKSDGATTYAKREWNSAVKEWQKAADEFSRMEFSAAKSSFESASSLFSECGKSAKAEERRLAERKAEERRAAELKQAEEENRREIERQRTFAKYAAVKVGSLVQISTEANVPGRLGIVESNRSGVITLSMKSGSVTVTFEYPYGEIVDLIVRGDVDENAIMRRILVGRWVGNTTYGTSGASVAMRYEYVFSENGSVQMNTTTTYQTSNTQSSSGTWEVARNGKDLVVHVTSGRDAGDTIVFNLIKRSDGSVEFRYDLAYLNESHGNNMLTNRRQWYDAAGVFHLEGDSKSGWSTVHVSNTETPRIMRRIR